MNTLLYAFLCTLLLLQNVECGKIVKAAKTCEDVLQPQTCVKLRDAAKIFHEHAGTVNEAVQSAITKHITTTQNIIKYIKQYLVEKANNFKCEDVLSTSQCSSLVKIAGKFKLSITNVTRDIEEAIVDGIVKGKALYQKTIEIMLEKINNLSCEQLVDKNTCQKIENFGSKVHASSKEIMKGIIDAYSKHLTNVKDFINDAIHYIVNELSCDKVLSTLACSRLQYLSDKFGTPFNSIVDFLRESLVNGVTQVSELYKDATHYIMKSWMGLNNFKITKRSVGMTEDEFMATLDLLENYVTAKRF